MISSPLVIALLSLVAAAPIPPLASPDAGDSHIVSFTNARTTPEPISQSDSHLVRREDPFTTWMEGAITNARQVQDTLNRQLQSDGGVHSNANRMVAYITGADSQIDNVIAVMSDALAPYSNNMSKVIGNYLLGPYVQSVTNGAEVMLANLVGNSEDVFDAELIGRMTGDYSRLIALGKQNNVDTSKLENLNERIMNTMPKVKREIQEHHERATELYQTGIHGAMTNAQQVQDTLNRELSQSGGDPHANADRLTAFITGADSQIDNAIATVSEALAPFTGGYSKAIGGALLGPFVQSVTNGAEVVYANMIGGSADYMDAEMIGRLTGDYSRLTALSSKYNVDTTKLQNLNEQIQMTLPKSN